MRKRMVELIIHYSDDLTNEQIIDLATYTDEQLLEWIAELMSTYFFESQRV